MTIRYPLTVFYDASCPLCAAEMRALQSRDQDGRLLLVDCSAADFDESVLAGVAIRRHDLMAVMHARDAHGRWYVGVDALEQAYAAAGRGALAGSWGGAKHSAFSPEAVPR